MKLSIVLKWMLISTLVPAMSVLIEFPTNQTVTEGQPVLLICRSTNTAVPAIWNCLGFCSVGEPENEHTIVFMNDVIAQRYDGRVTIILHPAGAYHINFTRTVVGDSGLYWCVDESGAGETRYAYLVVNPVPTKGYAAPRTTTINSHHIVAKPTSTSSLHSFTDNDSSVTATSHGIVLIAVSVIVATLFIAAVPVAVLIIRKRCKRNNRSQIPVSAKLLESAASEYKADTTTRKSINRDEPLSDNLQEEKMSP